MWVLEHFFFALERIQFTKIVNIHVTVYVAVDITEKSKKTLAWTIEA